MAIAKARSKKLGLIVAWFSFRAERAALSVRQPPKRSNGSPAILSVADLLHPVDEGLLIDLFLNGDMRHRSGWGSTVPMLFTRWDPNDIAGMDLLNGTTLMLDPTAAGGDNEDLTQRMRVPGVTSTRLARNASAANAGWRVCIEQGVDTCGAGKIFSRRFGLGL